MFGRSRGDCDTGAASGLNVASGVRGEREWNDEDSGMLMEDR